MYRILLLIGLVLFTGCASRRGGAELVADARTSVACDPQATVTARIYVTFSD